MGDAQLDIVIRWLIRPDMPGVLQVESDGTDLPWAEDDFLTCLRQRNCIGMVAEHEGRVVGHMLYELHKSSLQILRFAVAPGLRRQRIGRRMIERLINKLSQQRRTEIVFEVREHNLGLQSFLYSQGFRAIHILREHFDDTGEDAYVMLYRLVTADDTLSFTGVNCISQPPDAV